MSDFFSMDSAFYRIGSTVADVMILSVIWLFFSIPVVTVGAATTALFYVTTRRISNREGYLARDFFQSFKSNFKKATLIWLLVMLLVAVLILNILNIGVTGNLAVFLLPVYICFLVEIVFICIYVFPLVSRFDMGFRDTLKTSFFMANRHIFTTITCLAAGAAVVMLGLTVFPPIFVVGMGVYAYAASYMIMRVFRKYRPDMDKETLELQKIE
jgi:uncharacterized membrane protein YesL